MKNEKWFELPVDAVEKKLKTNAASGLSRKAARSRVNKNAGSLFVLPQASPWRIFGELVSDFAWILLLLASFLSIFFEESPYGAVVFCCLLIQLTVYFITCLYCRRTMEGLQAYFYPKVKVIRMGRLFSVDGRSVVPGDVILLEPGDLLCADARLIHSDSLKLRMRVNRAQYTELEKYAEGFVRPGEHRPWEMTNMVHAGSVVLEGSARAIVTAVGKYTYLGAGTGGILFPEFKEPPASIKKLTRECSKWSMIMLLTVLPLCLLSLLIGHFYGGTVLLSGAFLTYMALIVGGITQLSVTVGIFFYVRSIRCLLRTPDPSVVRSAEAMERLGQIDYLFLRDGALLTDGIWHFSSAYSAEGALQSQHAKHGSAQLLCELVSLYHAAVTETVSTGLSDSARYCVGMDEFLNHYHVDRTALRIRYGIQSYLPGRLETDGDKVCLSDRGRRFFLTLTSSVELLRQCEAAMQGGSKQPWREEEKIRILRTYEHLTAEHQIPLIIMISADGSNEDACFVGLLAFKEGVDEKRKTHLQMLEKMGCRVISFLSSEQTPVIPRWAVVGQGASKQDFLTRGLPVTYRAGSFSWYRDMDDSDVLQLIDGFHRAGKKVAIASFEVLSEELYDQADLILSSAAIVAGSTSVGELVSMELSGNADSHSCTQSAKEKAELLLPRPSRKRGGLASLCQARRSVLRAQAGFSDFLRYLLGVQIIRIIVTILPLLMGKPLIDARHLIFCSCILDLFAFFAFSFGARAIQVKTNNYCHITTWKKIWHDDRNLILATVISSLSILILPWLMDLPGIFGTYLYRTEFVFTAIILLHFTALCCLKLRSIREVGNHAGFYWILGAFFCSALLLLGCYTSVTVGEWFSMEKNPLPYGILSVVPSIVFVLWMVLPGQRKKGKRE